MTNPAIPGPSLPGDVTDVTNIASTSPITSGEEKLPVGQLPFSSLMQEGKGATSAATGKTSMVSPFELAQGTPLSTSAPTLTNLMTQVKQAQSTLGDISTNINQPGLKLKPSQKYLLKNKMNDATTHLRAANTKMGAEIPGGPSTSEFKGPLGRFLALVGDGQQQLEAAQTHLQGLQEKGKSLNPGDFLMIQVKLNKAQQELEFSSVLLSNAVSAFKLLMNVQL
ncbi:MAG TPA: hypothetical protein VGJ00_05075 [Rhabdochlamydiaceae bacterium]|jgi:flagellar hook-basal body complex protein FliE